MRYSSDVETAQAIGAGIGMATVWLLCLVGVFLSCLGISGTWLVVGGTLMAAWIRPDPFPGWWTVGVFAVLSGLVELAEALAGLWGVRRRGGSKLAGFMAVLGGLAGLLLGSLIPIPVVGSLLGMVAGSFGLVFAVETFRLKHTQKAARIAWGAVIAHVLVILLKVLMTLGLAAWLLIGVVVR